MTTAQKAILVDEYSLKDISLDEYDVVYYGDEFCQNIIPSYEGLVNVKKIIGDKPLVLLTPYVTNVGLEKIKQLLQEDAPHNIIAELVVNDLGVLDMVHKEGFSLSVNLGRLLTKFIFREKRNMSVNNEFVRKLLEKNGVQSYEIGAVNDQVILPEEVPLHLYSSYFPLATTRRCLMGFPNGAIESFDKCNYSCKGKLYEAQNPAIKNRLLIKGNTYFLKHSGMPNIPGNCSRIIYHPLEKST